MSLGKESSKIYTWGKQYFKFGEVKFLKLKEVSNSILGEAIFWFGEGKLHNFTLYKFQKACLGKQYFEFGEGVSQTQISSI